MAVASIGNLADLLARPPLGIGHQRVEACFERLTAVAVEQADHLCAGERDAGNLRGEIVLQALRHARIVQHEREHLAVRLAAPDDLNWRNPQTFLLDLDVPAA